MINFMLYVVLSQLRTEESKWSSRKKVQKGFFNSEVEMEGTQVLPELGPWIILIPCSLQSPLAKTGRFFFQEQVYTRMSFKRLVLWCFLFFSRWALESNFSFLRQSKLLISWQVYFTQNQNFSLHSSGVRDVLSVYWAIALFLIVLKKNSLLVALILGLSSLKIAEVLEFSLAHQDESLWSLLVSWQWLNIVGWVVFS
jgi:hypothetical protein